MKDDCLLGNDFLSAMNFEEIFISFFGIPSQGMGKNSFCSRIMKKIHKVPQFFRELLEKETQELNEEQKERFAQFLTEFQDVFFKEIIAL